MFLGEQLSTRIHAIEPTDLPDAARHWARVAILDTVGVTLAGINEPMVDILRQTPGIAESPGPCLIQGTDQRTSALDAVLLNGVASHVHDFDDFSSTIGGHPSIMLAPLIMTIADMAPKDSPVSGADAILAYNVGFETMMRIAKGVNHHHYNKGWHPTATIGIFGSVAAAARLLNLDHEKTTMALNQAVSLASGVKANFGSMVKPLHIGHALRNALMAVLTAERGYLARPDAFDARQGYLDVFNGEGTFDLDAITQNWGDPFDIVDEGLGLKQFPCCGSTHAMINCALKIREDHQFESADIKDIEVLTHPLRIPHTDTPDPQTLVQAKFSTQYVVSRALNDGAVKMMDFRNRRPWDKQVRDLMQRVRYGEHPDMPLSGNNYFAGEVIVTLTDGEVYRHRQDHAVGRGIQNPMSDDELWGKYSDCAAAAVTTDAIKASFDLLNDIESLQDIRVINDSLTPHKQANDSRVA